MTIRMILSALAALCVLGASDLAHATLTDSWESGARSELDNEAVVTNEQIQRSRELPSTVVVRTHLSTGNVDILHVNDLLEGAASSQKQILGRDTDFHSIASRDLVRGELDGDSSSNSWYFYFYNYNFAYPTYSHYGYTYRYYPYYNFWWGGYGYTYYRWYW